MLVIIILLALFYLFNRKYFSMWLILTITLQPENCENRNDSDLVQAFLKKWWVESDFKAPNLPLSLRFKGFGCHYNSIIVIYILYVSDTDSVF
jgi:hypothetical protein